MGSQVGRRRLEILRFTGHVERLRTGTAQASMSWLFVRAAYLSWYRLFYASVIHFSPVALGLLKWASFGTFSNPCLLNTAQGPKQPDNLYIHEYTFDDQFEIEIFLARYIRRYYRLSRSETRMFRSQPGRVFGSIFDKASECALRSLGSTPSQRSPFSCCGT